MRLSRPLAAVTLAGLGACAPPPPVTVTVAPRVEAPSPPDPPVETKPRPRPQAGPVEIKPWSLGEMVVPEKIPSLPGDTLATPVTTDGAEGLRPLLGMVAATRAGGMAADAGPVAADFEPGEVLEMAFTLRPGRCYGAVAAGGKFMAEMTLEIAVVHPGAGPPVVLASGSTRGPPLVVGHDGCVRSPLPFPLPALLRIRMIVGGGLAGGLVMSR